MLQRGQQPTPALMQIVSVWQLVLTVAHRRRQSCLKWHVVRRAVRIHNQVAKLGGLGSVIELTAGADRRQQVVRAAFELALVPDLVQILKKSLRLLQLRLIVGDVLAWVEQKLRLASMVSLVAVLSQWLKLAQKCLLGL